MTSYKEGSVMKQTKISAGKRLMGLVLAGLCWAGTAQAVDLWFLPPDTGWVGVGYEGTPVSPSSVPIVYGNQIMFVSQEAVADYLQAGATIGYPNLITPLIVDGLPQAVPMWKVPELLKRGATASEDLVIMHRGEEQIAVYKAQIAEYEAKGYVQGPRENWTETVLMCFEQKSALVDRAAVEKYKQQGAVLGACPKK